MQLVESPYRTTTEAMAYIRYRSRAAFRAWCSERGVTPRRYRGASPLFHVDDLERGLIAPPHAKPASTYGHSAETVRATLRQFRGAR